MALAAALAAASACGGEDAAPSSAVTAGGEAATQVATEPAATPAPAAAAPGGAHERAPMFDGTYAPVSKTAMAITDEIAFENDTLQFGFGHTYETAPEGMIVQGGAAGRGFTEVLAVPAGTYVEIRRVTSELVNARAENGGLCKPEAAKWIVLAAVRDGQDVTRDVAMAAYKGGAAPSPAAADRELCGTFSYTRPDQ